MVRMMLDAHPAMAIPDETHFLLEAARAWRRSSDPHQFLEIVTDQPTWSHHGIDRDEFHRAVREARPRHAGDALRIFYRLYADRFDKPRWGDKTPHYLAKIRGIHRVLPEARFIHVIRDGRDVAVSIRDLWFGPDSIGECATWWVKQISTGRREASHVPHYMEVRYEDLVLQTEHHLRRICRFLDLEFDPCMLEYHRTSEERLAEMDAREVEIHGLLRQSPQRTRIGRWKNEMAESEVRQFEAVAAPILRELGYELSGL
jgi:hypothetical protein